MMIHLCVFSLEGIPMPCFSIFKFSPIFLDYPVGIFCAIFLTSHCAVVSLINSQTWMHSVGAPNAVPFTTLLALFALWFCVSVPLVFVGAVW